jgi:hypothetical protein
MQCPTLNRVDVPLMSVGWMNKRVKDTLPRDYCKEGRMHRFSHGMVLASVNNLKINKLIN